MKDAWQSIQAPSEGFYKVKGSKFYAYAFPVDSPEAAEAELEPLRKKHWDSRHVAFAWRFGREGKDMRAYDAGEPGHSAGDPILNEIRSRDLTQILVVVVRYFGGTKLGIPGLIDAYGSAAADALKQAEIIEQVAQKQLVIRYPYTLTSEINRVFHKHNLKAVKSEYTEDCRQVLEIRESLYGQIRTVFEELGILEE
jgi:uncharacterized YigZ family protein